VTTAQPGLASDQACPAKPTRHAATALLWLLVLVAGGEFLVRGVARSPRLSADFSVIWAASRAWLVGQDPYRHDSLRQVWTHSALQSPIDLNRRSWPILYPPNTFALLAPLAALPWPWARSTWLAVNLAALAVLLLLLLKPVEPPALSARAPEARPTAHRRLLLLAFVLAFAPLHLTIATGQLTLVSFTLGLLGCWASERRRNASGGIALGLGAARKPQIGFVLLAYALYRGQWRAFAVAVILAAAAFGIGAARLRAGPVPWHAELRTNLFDNAHAGSGDPTRDNPVRFQLINLQYPLHNFAHSRAWVNTSTFLVTGGASLAGLLLALRARRQRDLLLLGLWLTASLLLLYHRSYDALVLTAPLAWILARAPGGSGPATALALLALAAFLTPGAALLHSLAQSGRITADFTQTSLWQNWLLPHQVWALVVLLLVQLWLLAIARPAPRSPASGTLPA